MKTTNDIIFDNCKRFEIKTDYLKHKNKKWYSEEEVKEAFEKWKNKFETSEIILFDILQELKELNKILRVKK